MRGLVTRVIRSYDRGRRLMRYRRFGRTELPMPVISCGGMRYQYAWQDLPLDEIPAESQRNLEATVRSAVERGITHIETARGYGSSERQLTRIHMISRATARIVPQALRRDHDDRRRRST